MILMLGVVFAQPANAPPPPSPQNKTKRANANKTNQANAKQTLDSAAPLPASSVPAPTASSVPAAASSAPAPELPPTRPPVIFWDGKQLTVDAQNSTLADILLGIRSRTGASIEMPPSTSTERVAVHLGPLPIREVLTSLLYGTEFNYIIQASEEDENGLGKVILSARNKDEKDKDKDNIEDAVASADSHRHVRLMPGYAAPGKRDFEVARETASNDGEEASRQLPDASVVGESAAPSPGGAATNAETPSDHTRASGNSESSAVSPAAESADSSLPALDSGTPLVGESAKNSGAPTSSSSQLNAGDTGSISQMEQNLQRMYQQRRQLQSQQNQAIPPTAN
jgi:hypothetical protein